MCETRPPGDGVTPAVRIGQVASGNKLIDFSGEAFFLEVRKRWPQLLAIEMEGAGVALEVRRAVEKGQNVGFAMIRGISDMPPDQVSAAVREGGTSRQSEERDEWKRYASDAAACFAARLVRHRWPVKPRDTQLHSDQGRRIV